jgi:hypothetical protein
MNGSKGLGSATRLGANPEGLERAPAAVNWQAGVRRGTTDSARYQ